MCVKTKLTNMCENYLTNLYVWKLFNDNLLGNLYSKLFYMHLDSRML